MRPLGAPHDAEAWTDRSAPSLEAIEAIARSAFAALPALFREAVRDVVFLVREFPPQEVLASFEAETDFDLLGLYEGVSLAHPAASGDEPARISLYRRPILDYWAEHDETLGAVVRHVLIHEIGHHLGLSDADMDAIERRA